MTNRRSDLLAAFWAFVPGFELRLPPRLARYMGCPDGTTWLSSGHLRALAAFAPV